MKNVCNAFLFFCLMLSVSITGCKKDDVVPSSQVDVKTTYRSYVAEDIVQRNEHPQYEMIGRELIVKFGAGRRSGKTIRYITDGSNPTGIQWDDLDQIGTVRYVSKIEEPSGK